MAIKYTRDDGVHALRERKQTPYISHLPRRRPSQRRRLLLIYAGVLVFLLLLAGGQFLRGRFAYLGQPVRRGVGEVVGKETRQTPGQPATCWLRVRIPLEDGKHGEDLAAIDRDHWNAFEKGDQVGVLYQRANEGAAVRIHECGLVALPPAQ